MTASGKAQTDWKSMTDAPTWVRYPSIPNEIRSERAPRPRGEWVATEKVHGANFSIVVVAAETPALSLAASNRQHVCDRLCYEAFAQSTR